MPYTKGQTVDVYYKSGLNSTQPIFIVDVIGYGYLGRTQNQQYCFLQRSIRGGRLTTKEFFPDEDSARQAAEKIKFRKS